MLRIGPSFPGERGSFMKVDAKRKQVTLYDPSTVGHVSQTHRKMGVAAPKMFVYDAIFESDASQVSGVLETKLCEATTYLTFVLWVRMRLGYDMVNSRRSEARSTELTINKLKTNKREWDDCFIKFL